MDTTKWPIKNQIDYVIGRRWKNCVVSAKASPGADCRTDHELLISNTGVKLRSNERIVLPKYNVNNIPNGFKMHIKYRFALLNLSDQEPELQTDARNIIWKECKKTMLEVERKGKKKKDAWDEKI